MELKIPPETENKNYDDLHPNAKRGIDLFNQKEFFEAHEELELAWRAETDYVKELYRGILQVGVAYYHIAKMNFMGAKKMFERALGWLSLYPDVYYDINVKQLKIDAELAYKTLLTLGPQQINTFPTQLFKPLVTIKTKE
jgi:predicted metal-dependent hydrolase